MCEFILLLFLAPPSPSLGYLTVYHIIYSFLYFDRYEGKCYLHLLQLEVSDVEKVVTFFCFNE